MTVYYADADRPDDTGDGLSPSTAKKTVGAAVTLAAADGSPPHTINIADGTYSETAFLNNANHVGITLQGESRAGTIITKTGDHTLIITSTVTSGAVQNLTLQVGGAKHALLKQSSAAAWTCEDVLFESLSTHTDHLFRSLGGAGLSISKCYFRFQYSVGKNPLSLEGDTAGTIAYSQFTAAATSHFSQALACTSSEDVNFYNNAILDTYQFGLTMTGSGTLTAINNVIQGGSIGASSVCLFQSGAGAFNADRNVLISGTANSGGWITGAVTEGAGDDANIKTNGNPRFLDYPRRGCIIPRIDDVGGLAYVQAVAPVLAEYGFKGTWYLNQFSWNSADSPALRTLVEDGIFEIASHGYTHTKMTITGTIFTVTKGAETITTDRSANTITLSGGGTVSGFRAKTLGEIKTELEGFGASVATTNYGIGGVRAESLGEVFDDGAANNILEVLHDATGATGLEKSEIADVKGLLTSEVNDAGDVTDGQTGATYACNTFGFPYNDSSADNRAACRAVGYLGSQSGASYSTLTTVVDLNLFHIGGIGGLDTTSETTIRAQARAVAFSAAQTGFAYFFLSHDTGQLSIEQWGWICEEWALFGGSIRVTSMQLFAKEVIDGVWADDGDGTYSRTYGYSDLHLRGNSPCINAGADVGLTSDVDGRAVPQGWAPDIGVYESTPTFIPARLLPMLPYPGPRLTYAVSTPSYIFTAQARSRTDIAAARSVTHTASARSMTDTADKTNRVNQ